MRALSTRPRLLSVPVRVHVVDPSAFTPPYDHALCRALAAAGADVELYTSRFAYAAVAAPEGYERHETFYRAGARARGPAERRVLKIAEHVPDMLRYRRAARSADVVHFQWLTVQHVDRHLLPANRSPDGARRPLVLTAHDILPREPRPGQRRAQRRLYDRFDAIVVHTEHGRRRLIDELGIDPARVHVIAHGVLSHLAEQPPKASPVESRRPLVLCFGLMRPYKGIDVLLRAWRGIEDAELWIVGLPRMDIAPLRSLAPPGVQFDARFIPESELPDWFRRADLVVLPYLEIDQSGVLLTALAFGKPLLLSDAGGFPEMEATGAARIVPAGDPEALHRALRALLEEPGALAEMGLRARAAAEGEYAWAPIARRTLELYESLLRENHRP
jgi:glycosyltransferase involved in cell wall biosynthesis